jgi:hypothetical protein
MANSLTVTALVSLPSGDHKTVVVLGRVAWALLELIEAGKTGCTSIDNPAPRWSSYVHRLRHDHGIDIETIHESHGGPFAGQHARYVVRSDVEIVSVDQKEAA